MGLMKRLEPRRFNYQPRFYKPTTEAGGDSHRIRFRRVTKYDPHSHYRLPWILIAVALILMLILLYAGGVRPTVKPLRLTTEDVVGFTKL